MDLTPEELAALKAAAEEYPNDWWVDSAYGEMTGMTTGRDIARLIAEVERLRSALPRTADGVTITPGMTAWRICGTADEVSETCVIRVEWFAGKMWVWDRSGAWEPERFYSTRAAAEAAKP